MADARPAGIHSTSPIPSPTTVRPGPRPPPPEGATRGPARRRATPSPPGAPMAPEPFRTPARRLLSAALMMLALAAPAHALRLVNYNILNYPGTSGPSRDPSFRTILAPLSPDVLIT